LQAIQRSIAEVNTRRDQALLDGAPAAAIHKIDDELATQQHAERTETDRILVLEKEVERQRIERQAQEKNSLIERIEKRAAERTAAVGRLQEHIAGAVAETFKAIDLSRQMDAAWPFSPGDRVAVMLNPSTIMAAISHELYRIGSRPRRYGGVDTDPNAGLNWPGAKSPKLEFMNIPEAIPPIVDVVRDAANYAYSVMRGKAIAPPATMIAGSAEANAPAPKTAAQERLNQLLQQQIKLSMNPAAEAEYLAVVAEIATVSAEVDAQAKGVTQ
jgi:hypothetical protein